MMNARCVPDIISLKNAGKEPGYFSLPAMGPNPVMRYLIGIVLTFLVSS